MSLVEKGAQVDLVVSDAKPMLRMPLSPNSKAIEINPTVDDSSFATCSRESALFAGISSSRNTVGDAEGLILESVTDSAEDELEAEAAAGPAADEPAPLSLITLSVSDLKCSLLKTSRTRPSLTGVIAKLESSKSKARSRTR